MEYKKKISSKGSVSIPIALRRDYGIEPGAKLQINVARNGDIILKQLAGACLFCGSEQNLRIYEGRYICQECATRIGQVKSQ